MRIVRDYKIPTSCLVKHFTFPVTNYFTGRKTNRFIYVCSFPYGRTFYVVPRIGFVGSIPFDCDILDLFSDGVFYDIDSLYESLNKGGLFWYLGMSKSYFYHVFKR